MKATLLLPVLAAALTPAAAALSPSVSVADYFVRPAVERRAGQQSTFHFADVMLRDGEGVYEHAEIHIRVKDSAGGYTRADYFDQQGHRLGFYEAFEVVSQDGDALRAWAIRNFRDRTSAR